MKTLLNIRASLFGADSASARLVDHFARNWRTDNPDGRVVTRDLTPGSVPQLTAERYLAFNTRPADRSEAQQAEVRFSDELVAELESADVIALAVPMYNFSVPSTLRNYFDHIARAGITFRYTTDGPEGLLKGKRTYVFITRGGRYAGEADTQRPYLEQFLGFIGLSNIHFVLAEGLAMGEDAQRDSLAFARKAIDGLQGIAA